MMCREAGFAGCEVEKMGGRLGALARGVPVAGRVAEVVATSVLVAATA
jgi:hypothetical protein